MSKVSFRARALDAQRAMPVFDASELPDLSEYAAINRAVPAVPTGMERDEEMELHLQQAISAQQASTSGMQSVEEVVIPTPRVIQGVTHYDHMYPSTALPSNTNYIKVDPAVEYDREQPDYECDAEDSLWLASHQGDIHMDVFELVMDRLETASERQVIKLSEAKTLLTEVDDDTVQNVYDYWLEKRVRTSEVLLSRVRTDRRLSLLGMDAQIVATDPYVAFRRRAEKMQTRKNRRNDEDSYEKILKLSHDLRKAVSLLDMIRMRERSKREQLRMDEDVFEWRQSSADYDGCLLAQAMQHCKPSFSFAKDELAKQRAGQVSALRRKRKRQHTNNGPQTEQQQQIVTRDYLAQAAEHWHDQSTSLYHPVSQTQAQTSTSSVSSPPTHSLEAAMSNHLLDSNPTTDGQFAFKRKRGCVYYASTEQTSFMHEESLPSTSAQYNNGTGLSRTPGHSSAAFYRTYMRTRPHGPGQGRLRCIGMARQRRGRGGRLLYDRLSVPARIEYLPSSSDSASTSNLDHDHNNNTNTNVLPGRRHVVGCPPSHPWLYNRTDHNSNTHSLSHTNTNHNRLSTTTVLPPVSTSSTSLSTDPMLSGRGQHSATPGPSEIYYRCRSPVADSSRPSVSGAEVCTEHSYSRLGWPRHAAPVPGLGHGHGLWPVQHDFSLQLDSGYSSPTELRSRSSVRERLHPDRTLPAATTTVGGTVTDTAQAHDDYTTYALITQDQSSTVSQSTTRSSTLSGRNPLRVPISVGVSSALYWQHTQQLQENAAQQCAHVSATCCRLTLNRQAQHSQTETDIEKGVAIRSAGAVQDIAFVRKLWQDHQTRHPPANPHSVPLPVPSNGLRQSSHTPPVDCATELVVRQLSNGHAPLSSTEHVPGQGLSNTNSHNHSRPVNNSTGNANGTVYQNGHADNNSNRNCTNTSKVDYVLPTPSPSPNSPRTDSDEHSTFKPIENHNGSNGTHAHFEPLTATRLVDRHRSKHALSPLHSSQYIDDINTSPVSQNSSVTSNDVDGTNVVPSSPTHNNTSALSAVR